MLQQLKHPALQKQGPLSHLSIIEAVRILLSDIIYYTIVISFGNLLFGFLLQCPV